MESLEVPGLIPFQNSTPDTSPAFYKLGFRYDPAAFGLSRDLFVAALRAEGIAFDAGFKALHIGRSPTRFRVVGALPNASAAHERCVILHHPVLSLSRADVQQVAEAVAKAYRFRDMRSPSASIIIALSEASSCAVLSCSWRLGSHSRVA